MEAAVVELVPFTAEHLDGAAALSGKARWPHRREDWAVMLGLSRGVVALDGDGTVVGTTFMTPYGPGGGPGVATVNMVIVDEALRGQGIGRLLVSAAIAKSGGRQLRLVSTPDGQALYHSLGFAEHGGVHQRQGHVAAVPTPADVEAGTPKDWPAIQRLDREAFGADRSALLRHVAETGQLAVVRRGGTAAAFAGLRPFGRGLVIGPVVAASTEDARALSAFFAAPRAGTFLRLDLTDGTGLEPWLDAIGLVEVDRGLAMRTVAPASGDGGTARTYALASQALG